MLTDILLQLYKRDLEKLKSEVEQYSNEADLWKKSGDIPNSGGNLCLHLCGNLRHFIGAVLGSSGYVRDRDAEFSNGGVMREEIYTMIDATLAEVTDSLSKLSEMDLAKKYPIEVFGHPMTTEYFLVHLATHLNYHLGQIDYHRRLIAAVK